MSADGPPVQQEFAGSRETREILQFLRQQNDDNRAALREEADANRQLLLNTAKLAAFPLTAIITVAAFLGWRSYSDFTAQVGREALEQARQQAQAQVQARLDKEFGLDEIHRMIQDAAIRQTQLAAGEEIKSEVASQIQKETPAIRQAAISAADAASKNAVATATDRYLKPFRLVSTASSPLYASLYRLDVESFSIAAGQPVKMTSTMVNVGRSEARDITYYVALRLSETTQDDVKRLSVFRDLVEEIEKQRVRDPGPSLPGSIDYSKTFDVRWAGPIATRDQVRLIDNGQVSIFVAYVLRFNSSQFTYYCGSLTGDLKRYYGGCQLPGQWYKDVFSKDRD